MEWYNAYIVHERYLDFGYGTVVDEWTDYVHKDNHGSQYLKTSSDCFCHTVALVIVAV